MTTEGTRSRGSAARDRTDRGGQGHHRGTERDASPKAVHPSPASDNGVHKPRYTTRHDVESLGVSLGPALHEECSDRLGDIEWFRSPWQKSGAATGKTTWRLPDGSVIDAIVKVPIGPNELFWATRMGEVDPMWWASASQRRLPVPRVLASGAALAGYDIAWVVQERLAGKPVSQDLTPANLEMVFAAAAEFHKLAGGVLPVQRAAGQKRTDWASLLARGEAACRDNNIPDADRWLEVIGHVRTILPDLLRIWRSRPMDTWCHGDLHPGNVLTRVDPSDPEERCGVLIDLAMVHAGHWVEDALYLERLYWGREEFLHGHDPLESLAGHRRAIGLSADAFDERLADVRRVLMGATSPAFLGQENDPVYLPAALDKLRYIIPRLGVS